MKTVFNTLEITHEPNIEFDEADIKAFEGLREGMERYMQQKEYQNKCDKCKGTGLMFSQDCYLFFRWWRQSIGLGQNETGRLLGMDKSNYSRFENGHMRLSNNRLLVLLDILKKQLVTGKPNKETN